MSDSEVLNRPLIQQWINEGLDADKIRQRLSALGLDEEAIAARLEEFKKQKHKKRLANGFILMATGSLLGFIGCVLAMLNFAPSLHGLFLFGFTSVAILIVLAGLYMVVE